MTPAEPCSLHNHREERIISLSAGIANPHQSGSIRLAMLSIGDYLREWGSCEPKLLADPLVKDAEEKLVTLMDPELDHAHLVCHIYLAIPKEKP